MKKFLKSFTSFSVVFLIVLAILLIVSAIFMIVDPNIILTLIYCGIVGIFGLISLVIVAFLIINLFSLKKKTDKDQI